MKTIYVQSFLWLASCLFFASCDLEKVDDFVDPGGGGNEVRKFNTTVGGNGNDFPADVIAASDSGYVVAGYSQSFTPNLDNQAYLVKVNSQGNQVWEQNFGGSQDDYARAVTEASDGGFVFVGYTYSFSTSQDVFFGKVNASGGKVWDKFYGAADSSEFAFGVVQLNGGDFLIGFMNENAGNDQIRLLRVNGNGSKISDKTVQTGDFYLNQLLRTSDGKIVLSGSEFSTGGTVSYILKVEENGSYIWDKRFPATATNYTPAYGLTELPDKNLALAGSDLGDNDHDFNVVNFNEIGGKLWDRAWGGAKADELFGIAATLDSQLVVMGYTNSFSSNVEIYLSKRKASDGSEIWERHFLDIGSGWGDVETALDGGFVLVAGQNVANADVIIVKTDKDGNFE